MMNPFPLDSLVEFGHVNCYLEIRRPANLSQGLKLTLDLAADGIYRDLWRTAGEIVKEWVG